MHSLRGSRHRGIAFLPILLLIALLGFLWLQRGAILGWFGTVLVSSEQPVKADAIVVLAGGWGGERVLKAAQLMQQGFAPIAFVSDAVPFYEVSECKLAIEMAVRHGARPEWFECTARGVRSTREEAASVVKQLRARGVKRYLLVTTEFHTRRAAGLFRDAAPEIALVPIAADSVDFEIRDWYRNRQGQKVVFQEWTKMVTGVFGI